MDTDSFVVAIGGKAGQGILSAGNVFFYAMRDHGFHIFAWSEYPSLIKGGHNMIYARISTKPVYAPKMGLDVLVALDAETVQLHYKEVRKGGAIVCEESVAEKFELSTRPSHTTKQHFYGFGVPFTKLSREIDNSQMYVNTVAVGSLFGVLNGELKVLDKRITDKFGKKHKDVLDGNLRAAKAGYDFVTKNFDKIELAMHPSSKIVKTKRALIDGSTALAYGAIKGGLGFTSAYPMTPATPVFDILIKLAAKFGYGAKQVEDEITAISMAIGAGYTGNRALTMTSGGGFDLMTEAFGLAGMAEVPLVVIEAQRGGPSTGLPTKTEQSDLRTVLHASHGEFPRLILAPGDVRECYDLIQQAFNFAEKYQLPVVVLTDKYLAVSQMEFEVKDLDTIEVDRGILVESQSQLGEDKYKRYLLASDGVSPRALPGLSGIAFLTGSDEHNELGELSEDKQNRIKMMDKRLKKEKTLLQEVPLPKLYGPKVSDVTLICWGSTKHACLEASEMLAQMDYSVNVMHFSYVYPLNVKKLLPMLAKLKKAFVVENNATGQFAGVLTQYVKFIPDGSILKYTGEAFFPEEIADEIHKKYSKK
jgi:2-oxoglutarate ferredoxin oxidoreductase subunit alpha